MEMNHMICPRCGAELKLDEDRERAHCEYCGHTVLLEREETAEEIRERAQSRSYGYHSGRLEAEARARRKDFFWGILKKLIIVGVIALIIGIATVVVEVSKSKVNPFDYIEVSFQGNDGKGEIVIEEIGTTDDINLKKIDFDISKNRQLAEGETIKITAQSQEYRLTETTRTYTVEGLDEYLKDLKDLPEEALEIIHSQAQSSLDINLSHTKNAEVFVDMKPVKLFLLTDGKQTNTLYDVFEVHFNTRNGELTKYVTVCFNDVLIREGEQISIDMSYGMYIGHLTEVSGAIYITGYDSVDRVKNDILTSQESYMELKELDL